MPDEPSHFLLQQTPLSVNPFIDLPKPPTLPPNYATLPSTLPPSSIHVAPAASNPDLPAYVTSSSGFAAHPSTVIAQNKALLQQLHKQRQGAEQIVEAWEQAIRDRELADRRRKAPGWLDSDNKMLEPEKVATQDETKFPAPQTAAKQDRTMEDLGAAMDRAFGGSKDGS